MLLDNLYERKLIQPPSWLINNVVYLTLMGSQAYGSTYENSDHDIYGICIPRKEQIFPHLSGLVHGFDDIQGFEQWQYHNCFDPDKNRVYDFTVFGIVKYFRLLMDNNPNVIDSIFVPADCVQHITPVGQLIRDNRKMFLHKGIFYKLRGYSLAQLHKMSSKVPIGKRKERVERDGFDRKFGYHVVRLLSECEDILLNGDLDLRKNSEQLKAIRRGDMSEEEIRKWASDKERHLENLYHESKLQNSPPVGKIRALLLQCLEAQYGSLDKVIVMSNDKHICAINDIKLVLERYNI
jgi:predicted nucleotidyltransferase